MKLALILNVIDPKIGGVMIMGDRGTGKTTTIRALADLLPQVPVVAKDPFNSGGGTLGAGAEVYASGGKGPLEHLGGGVHRGGAGGGRTPRLVVSRSWVTVVQARPPPSVHWQTCCPRCLWWQRTPSTQVKTTEEGGVRGRVARVSDCVVEPATLALLCSAWGEM